MVQKVARDAGGCFLMQFDKGEFAGAVDGNEEMELALLSADLGDVDVEVAERVALELASFRFAPSTSGRRDMP